MKLTGTAAVAALVGALATPAFADEPFNWTGFYLGANAGYGFGNMVQHQTSGGMPPGPFEFDPKVYSFAGHAGYNHQIQNLVLGVELSGGWNQVDGEGRIASSVPTKYQAFSIESGWYGEATGRLGFALDRTLVYGKGGYAYHSGGTWQTTTNPGFETHDSDALKGWVYGGGIEQALNSRVSLRLEYLHYDFGKVTGDQTSVSDPPIGFVYTNSSKIEADTIRLGVSVKLN